MNETHPGPDIKIDDLAIKKMAGEAISRVDGVLGMDGSFTDLLMTGDERILGISLASSADGGALRLSAKIVTEYGKNIPAIVAAVQRGVTDALQGMTGLTVEKVAVEVTDTMTRADYAAKCGEPRGTN